jgi:hypothetical protein
MEATGALADASGAAVVVEPRGAVVEASVAAVEALVAAVEAMGAGVEASSTAVDASGATVGAMGSGVEPPVAPVEAAGAATATGIASGAVVTTCAGVDSRGRGGAWAHAARARRAKVRSPRGVRLRIAVAKFRTLCRRATFPARGHGSIKDTTGSRGI